MIAIDKLGQIDLVAVRLGDNEEFPFTIVIEVHRDGDGRPQLVRILNEIMPIEFVKDFSKFLSDLSKEQKTEASICPISWDMLEEEDRKEAMALKFSDQVTVDLVKAGEKLERCVRSIMQRRIKEFRQKNGKEPSAKKRQEIESSAFAICRSQGLK